MNAAVRCLSAAAFAACGVSSVLAAPVSSFGTPNAGWNVGTGQPADGFALSTNGGPLAAQQVGLRAQDYLVGVSSNDGVSTYTVAAGERSPGSGLAKWNLDLSIDGDGTPLKDYDVSLTIDWDPTAGVDAVTYDLDALFAAQQFAGSVYQASENLGFSYWNHAFNAFATGIYVVTLSIVDREGTGQTLASQTININVVGNAVPEPGSFALAGLALAGLALARRRRA